MKAPVLIVIDMLNDFLAKWEPARKTVDWLRRSTSW